nr:hypothetical protein [Chthoniobacter flavus]
MIRLDRLREIVERPLANRIHGGADRPFLAHENELSIWRNAVDFVHQRDGVDPLLVEGFYDEVKELFFCKNERRRFIRGN